MINYQEKKMNTIKLKNIRSLSGLNFFIPNYQRGYRWSESEAKLLLNDLKEFCKRVKEEGEFYCLQPIVVRKRTWNKVENGQQEKAEGYEVIDGQQRLTTLFILLKFLEIIRTAIYKDKFKLYTINYETRFDLDSLSGFNSQYFLENIDKLSNEQANDFIDFYYMKSVYNFIKQWFEDESKKQVDGESIDLDFEITRILLEQRIENNVDKVNNVRVIWYEVTEEDSSTSVDIFTRLNIGKIPLTNAELIKALLLCRGNFCDTEATAKQIHIATEWNLIEQKLQNDSFWYFLVKNSSSDKYVNRIEYIFDLMTKRKEDSEFYYSFIQFNKKLWSDSSDLTQARKQSAIEALWLEVKQTFQTLEEWYNDRSLYHFIGFLIENGEDVNKLIENSRRMKKSEFLSVFIKEKIKQKLNLEDISDLNYGDEKVKKVLLLFNILEVMKSDKSNMRFPFSDYKKQNWDIEHISSQQDQQITNDKQRLEWKNDMLEYLSGSSSEEKVEEYKAILKTEIQDITSSKSVSSSVLGNKKAELDLLNKITNLTYDSKGRLDDYKFEEVFRAAQKFFNEDKLIDKDNIRNLALLDEKTNRGYGNSFFPIKRKWIIENDKQGIFVPIATKNVFLKYYSRKSNGLMFWENTDADDYLNDIQDTLNEYFRKD